jgi:hypothetical protein
MQNVGNKMSTVGSVLVCIDRRIKMWHVDLFLGNDCETSKYTTAVIK